MTLDYSYHYRKWHDNSPEHEQAMIRYYKPFLGRWLPQDKAARILDVGCGMGFVLSTLRDLGYASAEGLDMDANQVEAARERGLNVTQSANTEQELASRKESYDQILALDLLEHIPMAGQIAFVQHITEALKPGGSFLCTVPNANASLAARWRYIDWTHHCSFTEHSLDFLLHSGGLKEIQVMPLEFIERPKLWWLPLGGSRHYWAFRMVRLFRRVEMMAELGPEQGRSIPLSLNLLAFARKK